MSATERFDRVFEDVLADLAEPRYPTYIDDVLERATRGSQRPSWMFPERWLPMTALMRALPLAPGLPWRRVALLAVLALLAAVTVMLAIGSQVHRAPPYGPAANGLVTYMLDFDIYGRDLATGQSRLVIGGDGMDAGPTFSRDGSSLAFVRLDPETVGSDHEQGTLYVAAADGSNQRPVFGPAQIAFGTWSPDGREIALVTSDATHEITIVSVADGASRILDAGLTIGGMIEWRPPDGRELVFHASGADAIYALRTDGSGLRRITLEGQRAPVRGNFSLTPDGGSLVYMSNDRPYSLRIVDLGSGAERPFGSALPVPAGGPGEGPMHAGGAQVSADGSTVVFARYWDEHDGEINYQIWVASLLGDGSDAIPISPLVRTAAGGSTFIVTIAPDGSRIVVHREDTSETWISDFDGSNRETVDWGDIWDFSWQRVAP
jgi:Tol biopolymer transport system component